MSENAESKQRYYNTTDSPYTMDADGHILGGGEHGEFASSHQIQLGLASGKLLEKDAVEEKKSEANGKLITGDGAESGSDKGDDSDQPPKTEPKTKKSKVQTDTEVKEK